MEGSSLAAHEPSLAKNLLDSEAEHPRSPSLLRSRSKASGKHQKAQLEAGSK